MDTIICDGVLTPKGFVQHGADDVQRSMNEYDDSNLVGETLVAIATKLVKPPHKGIVPSTKAGLLSVKVNDMVAAQLMQHIF